MHAEPPIRKRRRKSRFSAQPDDSNPVDGKVSSDLTPIPESHQQPEEDVPPAVAALRARVTAELSKPPVQPAYPVREAKGTGQLPTEAPKPKRRRTRFSSLTGPQEKAPPAQSASSAPPLAAPTPVLGPTSARAPASELVPTTVDLNAIPVAPVSTLRINRATRQKRKLASLKVSAADFIDENPIRNPYYDPALNAQRKRTERKQLVFAEPGIHAARAQRLREEAAAREKNAKFQESLVRQRQTSPLPVLPPRAEDVRIKHVDLPFIEWWDAPLMKLDPGKKKDSDNHVDIGDENIVIREERITHYIHHPPPVKSTVPPTPLPEIPLMLTKKETKKLRRQRRLEAHKEEQEMMAVGLLPPPKPKVKLSNLMRVLASEATADPTKVEAEVRAQVEERRLKHEAQNAARKRTPEERKEKVVKKLEKDKSAGLFASVYRISKMNSPHHRFKVDVNARQLEMTGVLVLFQDCNVVVVEGGIKAQRKYKKLMLRRIDWIVTGGEKDALAASTDVAAGRNKGNEELEDKDYTKKVSCVLVWEGAIQSPSFPPFRTMTLPTESACRHHFRKHHTEHYWDLCTQASPVSNENLGTRSIK